METITEKMKHRNGVLFALFLFQYSLTIPLMSFISSTIVVAVTSLGIMIVFAIGNRKAGAKVKVLTFLFVMLLVVVVKTALDSSASTSLISHYIMFIVPPAAMALYDFDKESFFQTSFKLAVINFFVLIANPFMPGYNYMRFGYGMVLTVIFLFLSIKDEKEKKGHVAKYKYAILLFSIFELFIYGARGCMISVALFYVVYRFLVYREKIKQNICIVIVLVVAYTQINNIIDLAYNISLAIGIGSYAVAKYRMQLRGGWEVASSGREVIYQKSIELIKQNPIIGNPIEDSLKDGEYVHNLFLQVAQDLGLIMLGIMIVILICVLIKTFSKHTTKEDRLILCVLFAVSIGRLMFSSTLWKRPEFWLMLSFYFSLNNLKGNSDERRAYAIKK